MERSGATRNEASALPPDLPHIAYVLLWYPLFTQPFIFSEVEGLRRAVPLQTYTLYGRNTQHCSGQMRENALTPRSYGVRGIWTMARDLVSAVCRQPLKVGRLFRRICFRRWPGWEVFGENLWAFGVGVSLGRRFAEDGIDLVYAPWPRGAATAAWVGATLADVPFAIAARGDNLDPADPDLGDKLRFACFTRANNAADKARIEAFDSGQASGKTVLIYNSLSIEPKDCPGARFSRKPLRLLAVGRFDVTKGFDVLMRACAILKRKNIDFQLTLAGGGGKIMGLGTLEKKLRHLRGELDLEREVTMPGLISHDELPRILAEHDIFVAPCVVHSSGKRDGIPNTVIEALAFGMPVIATTVNALPEVVKNGETGLTVEPGNPEALADAILWMAANPREALKMGAKGALLAREMFAPDVNAGRLAAAFVQGRKDWEGVYARTGKNPCAA